MRHLLQSFASTGTIQAINLLTGILVARLLLPEGRGELAIVILWPTLMLTVGFLGLDQAVIYHTARDRETRRRVFRAALLPGALLLGATALIGWFVLPAILEPEHGELLWLSRIFLLVSTPLHLVTNLLMAVLLGRQQVLQWNLCRLVQPACYLLGLLALWALDAAAVPNVMAVFLGSAAAVLLALGPAAYRALAGGEEGGPAPFRAVLGYAGRVHVQSVCRIANRRVDQALISLFLPAADLGHYVVAFALAGALEMAAGTVSIVAFPKISNLASAAGKQALFGRYFRFTLAMLLCGGAALWLLGGWILVVLFGEAYAPSVPILKILVLAAIFTGLSSCVAFGYKAHDRLAVVIQGEALALAAALPAFGFLLPAYGIAGAAWAAAIVQALPFCYMLLRLRDTLAIAPLALFLPTAEDAELLRRYRDSLRARLR